MRSVRSRFSDPSTTCLMWAGWLSGAPEPSHVEAELGGDRDLIAERLECFADQGFAGVRAVHLRGVVEGDALVVGGTQSGDALAHVGGRSVVGADAHAAGAEF